MSHPFPSLFSKKDKDGKGKQNAGFDSTDDEATISPSLAHHTAHNPTAKQLKAPDSDLTTGPCMTCDSTVRWPKELNVFRCTVCLTINDLKPILLESKNGDRHRVSTAVKAGGTHQGTVFPSSTRGMVPEEECTGMRFLLIIFQYLLYCLIRLNNWLISVLLRIYWPVYSMINLANRHIIMTELTVPTFEKCP